MLNGRSAIRFAVSFGIRTIDAVQLQIGQNFWGNGIWRGATCFGYSLPDTGRRKAGGVGRADLELDATWDQAAPFPATQDRLGAGDLGFPVENQPMTETQKLRKAVPGVELFELVSANDKGELWNFSSEFHQGVEGIGWAALVSFGSGEFTKIDGDIVHPGESKAGHLDARFSRGLKRFMRRRWHGRRQPLGERLAWRKVPEQRCGGLNGVDRKSRRKRR